MNKKGILIVVSGFSGAGKGTIMKELLKQYDNMRCLSLQPPGSHARERKRAGNISSKRWKNLKK